VTEQKHYTLLGNAEAYQEVVDRGRGGRERDYRDWEESQGLLQPQVNDLIQKIDELTPSQRLDEVVVEVKMLPRFLAKSYHPDSLLSTARLVVLGSDAWQASEEPSDMGRVLYVSGVPDKLKRVAGLLASTSPVPGIQKDFAKIESIRLPDDADRITEVESEPTVRHAIELVLYGWSGRLLDEAVRRLQQMLADAGTDRQNIMVRSYRSGATFVAAVVPSPVLTHFQSLNFLRLANPLPRIDITRMAFTPSIPAPREVPEGAIGDEWVAVVDGGVDLTIPAIASFVNAYDCTTSPPDASLVAHGTAVTSAALYGNIQPGGMLPVPPARVVSLRVLPDAQDDSLELYGVVDALELWVPRLGPNVRVVNLSIGPPGPIARRISRFTYALDLLAFETNKLIITAVGNWGNRPGLERIQTPSDAVNVLSVGAFWREPTTANRLVADYSCRGPGRSGAVVKPDVVAFGGAPQSPFFVFDSAGTIVGSAGTSLAAPFAARSAVDLLTRCPDFGPLATRAIMIHRAEKNGDAYSEGHGFLDSTTEAMVSCDERNVSVVYEGVIVPKKTFRLPFLLPKSYDVASRTYFSWTIVYLPEVDGNAHDEYCLCGLEVQFRPDSHVYNWNPPKGAEPKPKARCLHVVNDRSEIQSLESAGWTRGDLPVSVDHEKTTEHHRRVHDYKWETTVCCTRNRNKDIFDPAITVSVVPRGFWDGDDAVQSRYAAVLTVRSPKYDGDLYAAVVNEWPRLRAVPVRPAVPIRI